MDTHVSFLVNSIGAAAAIYEECSFLARNFSGISFVHCPRESNKVAHLLASQAEGPLTTSWYVDPPIFILDALANDVNLFEEQ